jgi:CRP/FNR family transcriptional regulator, cyclic AMP receptor protein
VRTLEQSEFHVADAPALLAGDPTVALYVAAILARRLDAANRSLIEVKRQLQAGEPPSVIGKTVEKVEETVKGYRDPTGW